MLNFFSKTRAMIAFALFSTLCQQTIFAPEPDDILDDTDVPEVPRPGTTQHNITVEDLPITLLFAWITKDLPLGLPGMVNQLTKEEKEDLIKNLMTTFANMGLRGVAAGLNQGQGEFSQAIGKLLTTLMGDCGDNLGGDGATRLSDGITKLFGKLGEAFGNGLNEATDNAMAGSTAARDKSIKLLRETIANFNKDISPETYKLIKDFTNSFWSGLGWGAAKASPKLLAGAATLGISLFTIFYTPKLLYQVIEKQLLTPKVLQELPARGLTLNANTFVGKPKTLDKLRVVTNLIKNAQKQNLDTLHLLFVGPPGVGKTEFCRFLADETGLKTFLFNMKKLPEGPKGAELFASIDARRRGNRFRKPCIMVIDEADTIIMSRKTNSHKHSEDTQAKLNALLAVTGSEEDKFVGLYIMITNTPEMVDEAILDRSLVVKFEDLSQDAKVRLFNSKMAKAKKNKSIDFGSEINQTTIANLLLGDQANNDDEIQSAVIDQEFGIGSGRGISKLCKYLTLRSDPRVKITKKMLLEYKKEFMSFMSDEREYSDNLQNEAKTLGLSAQK